MHVCILTRVLNKEKSGTCHISFLTEITIHQDQVHPSPVSHYTHRRDGWRTWTPPDLDDQISWLGLSHILGWESLPRQFVVVTAFNDLLAPTFGEQQQQNHPIQALACYSSLGFSRILLLIALLVGRWNTQVPHYVCHTQSERFDQLRKTLTFVIVVIEALSRKSRADRLFKVLKYLDLSSHHNYTLELGSRKPVFGLVYNDRKTSHSTII